MRSYTDDLSDARRARFRSTDEPTLEVMAKQHDSLYLDHHFVSHYIANIANIVRASLATDSLIINDTFLYLLCRFIIFVQPLIVIISFLLCVCFLILAHIHYYHFDDNVFNHPSYFCCSCFLCLPPRSSVH